jgi:uncharacterized iron-regulated protein
LLVAGNQHVRRDLGVPLLLNPALVSKTVVMASGESVEPSEGNAADQVWRTAPTPERDHCAEFKTQMAR